MSLESLAIEAETDHSQIHRMEIGKINFSISMLKKMAEALKITPQELLPPSIRNTSLNTSD